MTFFYHSTGGMYDFYMLLTICLAGIIFGGKVTRTLALVCAAYFLADRTALWFEISAQATAGLTAFCAIIAALVCLPLKTLAARGFIGLIALRVVADTFLFFEPDTMDTVNLVATAIGYLQLFIILGGLANDASGGGLRNLFHRGASVFRSGNRSGLASVRKWLSSH